MQGFRADKADKCWRMEVQIGVQSIRISCCVWYPIRPGCRSPTPYVMAMFAELGGFDLPNVDIRLKGRLKPTAGFR
jgi:hypothetical protein